MSVVNIALHLDQDPVFRTGETVSGHVCVSSAKTVDAGILTISIIGMETTCVKPKMLLRRFQSKQKRQERVVHKDESCLHDCSKTVIESGDTLFYFAFQLPTDLPPSMQLDAGQDGHCSVQYSISADLGQATASLFPTIVSASTVTEPQPAIVKPQCFPVAVKGSRSKGVLLLGSRVDKKVVGKRQRARVSLGCANYSNLNVCRIDIRLVEVVQWRQNKQSMERSILLSEDTDVRLHHAASTTRRRGECSVSEARRSMVEIASALSNLQSSVDVRIPSHARADCKSDLVKVWHYVEAVLVTRDGSSSPRIKVPLQIIEESTCGLATSSTKSKSLSFGCSVHSKSTMSLDTVDTCSVHSR